MPRVTPTILIDLTEESFTTTDSSVTPVTTNSLKNETFESCVVALVSAGFSPSAARQALRDAAGDVDHAAAILLAQWGV